MNPKKLNEEYFQSDQPVVYIDTETTGIGANIEEFRILEIALVKVDNMHDYLKHTVFHHYLNIEEHIQITKHSFKIHGITREDLIGKPMFEDIADEMLNFIEGCLIIGHNVEFDINFVNAALNRMQNSRYRSLPNKTIDSRTVAARRFPGKRVGLDSLITEVLKLPPRGHHSALEDAMYLAQIYPQLQKKETIQLFGTKDSSAEQDSDEFTFFSDIISDNDK